MYDSIHLSASLMMVSSAFLYSIQYLDVKMISFFGPWTISFFRGATGTTTSLLLAVLYVDNVLGKKKKELLIRGVLGGLSLITSFVAVINLDLHIATIIIAASPLWTIFFAKKETWKPRYTLASIACIGGLFLSLYRKDYNNKHIIIGTIAALCSSMLTSAVNVMVFEVKEEDTIVIVFYSMLCCLLISSPGMIYEQLHPNGNIVLLRSSSLCQFIELSMAGIFSFLAQSLKTRAIQLSNNLGIIILRYMDVIFSSIWDVLVFKNKIDTLDVIGMVIIMISCICIKCCE
jgi:drug/metabolite transporter (DMT)-like permease